MDNEEGFKVTFNPPLYLQRQRWVLDVLRREGVQSVLDIGCGEGSLLQCLTIPPQSTRPSKLPATSSFLCGPNAERHSDLYLREIHGLDPNAFDLEFAILATSPPDPHDRPFTGHERWRTRDARWMPLEVNLWEGGVEDINDNFNGDKIDAFVASEVIEHLEPKLLPLFAPIILGYYRPRLVLLTTPNFTYNQRFSPPGEISPTGYHDPTGRTNRVFRHHDHKFEWSAEEWFTFCTDAASKFGYEVEIDGVGCSVQPDPWNRDDILGFATQVAVFRRSNCHQRSAAAISLMECGFTNKQRPVLRVTHIHLPHPLSLDDLARPPVIYDIHQAVKEVMNEHREGRMTFENVWTRGTVSLRCAGDIAALIHAFEPENLNQEWSVLDDAKGWDGVIVWENYVPMDDAQIETDTLSLQDSDDLAANWDGAASEEPVTYLTIDLAQPNTGPTEQEQSSQWGSPDFPWGGFVEKESAPWGWSDSNDNARHTSDIRARISEHPNESDILEP